MIKAVVAYMQEVLGVWAGGGLSSKANSFASMKVLSCVFFDDVLCSYHKGEKFTVMDRCLKCRHYRRFERMMAEEEEFSEEVERVRRGELR